MTVSKYFVKRQIGKGKNFNFFNKNQTLAYNRIIFIILLRAGLTQTVKEDDEKGFVPDQWRLTSNGYETWDHRGEITATRYDIIFILI